MKLYEKDYQESIINIIRILLNVHLSQSSEQLFHLEITELLISQWNYKSWQWLELLRSRDDTLAYIYVYIMYATNFIIFGHDTFVLSTIITQDCHFSSLRN